MYGRISSSGSGNGTRQAALSSLLMIVFILLVVRPVAAEDAEATRWLERMGPALNMTTYRGVFVYARGDRVHSMRIAHRFHNGMVEERLVLQDGGDGEIVRKGMNVVCVLPERGRIRLDQVIPSGPFAEAFANELVPVSRWYQAELVGEDRIAGYDVVIIALTAKDSHRYSHRLWLEQNSGLLVKSHVGEPGGKVLEHFQFTSLEITDHIPDGEFEIQTEGREITRNLEDVASGEPVERSSMDGWNLGWHPEGFVPAAAPRSGRGQAVAFSDGVAAFSVFVEPQGKVRMPIGASRIGATTVYMRELKAGSGSFLVTVVGEIPPKTARQVAESVQIGDALAQHSGGS
ncbi:MucB/RseB C-terminal domain-containing protein [Marinobacter sp. F4218]|uniref:MucB/RseB C-terminal domain-containing protein n=1 Tax=Marinobacter sp. F4218 TaxID=2862868 RepID=UPI002B460049|nr:MucB/RseB C-terminal domain-containing protein [Marinobacter sp. F4218]